MKDADFGLVAALSLVAVVVISGFVLMGYAVKADNDVKLKLLEAGATPAQITCIATRRDQSQLAACMAAKEAAGVSQ